MAKILALKIYIDDESGEVIGVQGSKRFEEEGRLFKIDVLKDAELTMEILYKYELDEFEKEMNFKGLRMAEA